jgi:predicted enzyme related to lactoylglutathione lyase
MEEDFHLIEHIEIPAPDFTKAIEFYTNVFRWGIELVTVDHYAFFKIGNSGTGGAFDSSLMPAPEKTGPQLVISVTNMEQIMREIKDQGGTIVMGKTEIPGGHGFYSIFQDPNKNYMQLHSRQ